MDIEPIVDVTDAADRRDASEKPLDLVGQDGSLQRYSPVMRGDDDGSRVPHGPAEPGTDTFYQHGVAHRLGCAPASKPLDRQTATSEILRVISQSQTDVQPVFDTIVTSAMRLCDGLYRFDGELMHQVAQHNYSAEALDAVSRILPARPADLPVEQPTKFELVINRTR